ncbi:MAG: MerC domain-containing protein [Planctomycetota bacterium]
MNSAEFTLPKSTPEKVSHWRDWIGVVASVGCAIHCAAMPFVIAYLPALGLSFLADEAFHKWMALACFLIAIAAFLPGLRRHGSWIPIGVGSVGLGIITYAAFGLAGECCPSCSAAETAVIVDEDCDCDCEACEKIESPDSIVGIQNVKVDVESETHAESKDLLSRLAPWLTPFGGMMLVCAHLLNKRFGSCCSCC